MKIILLSGTRDSATVKANWGTLILPKLEEVVRNARGHRVLVLHGACPTGIDRMVGAWFAAQDGFEVIGIPAPWGAFGRRAGPLRNRWLLSSALEAARWATNCPVLPLAFPAPASSGTRDMIRLCTQVELPVDVVELKEAA